MASIARFDNIIEKRAMVRLNIAAVDLFCGIGRLTHGLIKAGIPVGRWY